MSAPSWASTTRATSRDFFVIGDLAGAPVIKSAMAQGYEVVEHIASLPGAVGGDDPELLDLLIRGRGRRRAQRGPAGRRARHALPPVGKGTDRQYHRELPRGQMGLRGTGTATPPKASSGLDGATKEDLVRRWNQIITDNQLKTPHP